MEQPPAQTAPQSDELTENEPPVDSKTIAVREPTHHEKTRAWVAYIIIGVCLTLYVITTVAYLLPGGDRVEGLAQTVLGGAQSLLGAVAGFYFANHIKE